ncbi:MAG: hypothetical protein IH886_11990 [Nitrospinae bacterium]|nr:hypothetical protein [Nitrospinota bacterium]
MTSAKKSEFGDNAAVEDMEKSKRWAIFLFIAGSLLVSACGVTKLYQHPALASPGSESAIVHVLRPGRMAGGGVSLPVNLNGVQLLKMKNATYTTVYLQPGSYEVKLPHKRFKPHSGGGLSTTTEAGFAQIELVAGGTYYLLVMADMRQTSSFFGGTHMHFINKVGLLSPEDGEELRNELEFIEVTLHP